MEEMRAAAHPSNLDVPNDCRKLVETKDLPLRPRHAVGKYYEDTGQANGSVEGFQWTDTCYEEHGITVNNYEGRLYDS